MNVAIIPDMHGSDNWQKVKSMSFDYCISLGDWFDSFTIPPQIQLDNFREYMKWVDEDPKHRLTCVGNHDFHYIYPRLDNAQATGFQCSWAREIHDEIMKYIDRLYIFITLDNICFSHAGITKTWLKNNKIDVKTLNTVWRTDPQIAAKLCFQTGRFYSANDNGDDVFQGPLWVRPNSLMLNSACKYQIVGHTEMANAGNYLYFQSREGAHVVFTDSAKHDKIFVLNTNNVKSINYMFYKQVNI
jgi:predicted phosphodiesterase